MSNLAPGHPDTISSATPLTVEQISALADKWGVTK